jgi:hypothetical protein
MLRQRTIRQGVAGRLQLAITSWIIIEQARRPRGQVA